MYNEYYFGQRGEVLAFSPLQVSQGDAKGLTKLTQEEIDKLENHPTSEELFDRLRAETACRLSATDQYGMNDYPDNEKRAAFRAYRAELRALNRQEGAPWDGGGELTPWPELPKT